jgi:hypothetical protein
MPKNLSPIALQQQEVILFVWITALIDQSKNGSNTALLMSAAYRDCLPSAAERRQSRTRQITCRGLLSPDASYEEMHP